MYCRYVQKQNTKAPIIITSYSTVRAHTSKLNAALSVIRHPQTINLCSAYILPRLPSHNRKGKIKKFTFFDPPKNIPNMDFTLNNSVQGRNITIHKNLSTYHIKPLSKAQKTKEFLNSTAIQLRPSRNQIIHLTISIKEKTLQ